MQHIAVGGIELPENDMAVLQNSRQLVLSTAQQIHRVTHLEENDVKVSIENLEAGGLLAPTVQGRSKTFSPWRRRVTNEGLLALGTEGPTWHDEANLAHLLPKIRGLDAFYQMTGSTHQLGEFRSFQPLVGVGIDRSSTFDLEIWPESGFRLAGSYTWGHQAWRGMTVLGERSDQRGLWDANRLYLDHMGKDTFYGLLASLRGQLFRDADFAEFYCADNGRDSVPPSLLATAPLLQTHDKVSDAEAKARADFDIRWKVALGIEIEDRPFAKSTLQVFRAQLILHDKVRAVFESSLRLARESGYLKKRGMRVALDTTNIVGRGAVRDTFNLLAAGIVKLLRSLAAVEQTSVKGWAEARGCERYLESSIKGESDIDWADKRARAALLATIVADADRLLEVARQAQGALPEGSPEREGIVAAQR